jgi:hypothetical protein
MRSLPGDREILSLIKHLDSLDRPLSELFRWGGGEEKEPGVITFPWVDYSLEVRKFVHDLYELGFIVPFDWPAWQEEGFQLQTSPGQLEGADLQDLVKLLTVHIRKDRFVEGHLAMA